MRRLFSVLYGRRRQLELLQVARFECARAIEEIFFTHCKRTSIDVFSNGR